MGFAGGTSSVASETAPVADWRALLQNPVNPYCLPGWIHTNADTGELMVADLLSYVPIQVAADTVFSHISCGVGVAGAASKVARLGIYTATEDASGILRPGTLVYDAGTVLVSATGVKDLALGPTTLTKGYYFLAVVTNGTPQLWMFVYIAKQPPVSTARAMNSIYERDILTCANVDATTAFPDAAAAATATPNEKGPQVFLKLAVTP